MTMENKGLPISELDDDEKRHLLRNTLWEPLLAHALISKRRRRLRIYSYSAAAAAILIVCSVTFFWLRLSPAPHYQYYQTKAGEHKSIKLPDGSVLTLNVDTRVAIDLSDWQKSRNVKLETGEVFFKIARNPEVPFVATTKTLSVRVLGTSFNVRAYGKDTEEVKVKTGKVQVENRKNKSYKVIIPGYMASLTSANASLIVQRSVASTADSWSVGVYQYQDQPLSRILSDLARMHNVEFKVIDNKELSRKYTLELANSSLPESIRKVELMGEIKMLRSGNTIYVKHQNN